MTNLAGLHLLAQHLPKVGLIEGGVLGRVHLVEIDVVGVQGSQRCLKLFQHFLGRIVQGAGEVAVELVAELGGDDPAIALAPYRPTDQRLGEVIAVALRCVDQIDAKIRGAAKQPVNLGLGEGLAPLAAELPGAQADHRHFQPRASQPPILHGLVSCLDIGGSLFPSTSCASISICAAGLPGYSSANSVQIMLSAGAPTVIARRRSVASWT